MLRFALGFDLSFKSPGWAIHDLYLNKFYVYAFAQKCRELNTFFQNELTMVRLLPKIPDDLKLDVEKYVYMEKYIHQTLDKHVPINLRDATTTKVLIEEYVYQSDRSKCGYNFKLHEFGGIIKRMLYVSKFESVNPIVASSWKKKVLGYGVSSKLNTIKFLCENGPRVNFLEICGYNEEDLTWDASKKCYHVETPCEDLADASAICLAVFITNKKIKKTKKEQFQIDDNLKLTKKRKKIIPIKQNNRNNNVESFFDKIKKIKTT